MKGPVRIVGLGSPHGDDAVGWEAVRRLAPLQGRVETLAALAGGAALLDLLDGRGTLILIDALAPAGAAGSIRRLDWPDARLAGLRLASTHGLGPAEALALARSLGTLPPRVVIFGMEAATIEPREGLSPAVAAALPELVRQIAAEVEALDHA